MRIGYNFLNTNGRTSSSSFSLSSTVIKFDGQIKSSVLDL